MGSTNSIPGETRCRRFVWLRDRSYRAESEVSASFLREVSCGGIGGEGGGVSGGDAARPDRLGEVDIVSNDRYVRFAAVLVEVEEGSLTQIQ